jgi:hypothetical protein
VRRADLVLRVLFDRCVARCWLGREGHADVERRAELSRCELSGDQGLRRGCLQVRSPSLSSLPLIVTGLLLNPSPLLLFALIAIYPDRRDEVASLSFSLLINAMRRSDEAFAAHTILH